MLVLPEVLIDQLVAHGHGATNTIALTLESRPGHYAVIDQIIWSADVTPQGNTPHITITNVVANTTVMDWDLTSAGAAQITFKDGLVASEVGVAAVVTMVAAQPSLDNHLSVIYR